MKAGEAMSGGSKVSGRGSAICICFRFDSFSFMDLIQEDISSWLKDLNKGST